ncbi:MAG: hypothetical protein KC620_12025, partial [Myxococcales bacterium]|nr:hypothetical protein [Myxococcales bacterium]
MGTGLLANGCLLDAPESDGWTLEVVPRQTPATADGVGIADIIVHADQAGREFRATAEIRVTSGSLGAGGQQDFRARVPEDGVLTVPLTYGRQPGTVVVE